MAESIAYESDPLNSGYGVWYYEGPLNQTTGYAMYRVYGFPTVQAMVEAAETHDFRMVKLRRKLALPSALSK